MMLTLQKKLLCCVAAGLLNACASAPTIKPSATDNADSKTAVASYYAQGWGATTCEQLSLDLSSQQLSSEQALANRTLYQAWISGFVSGVNYADFDISDISGDTDAQHTLEWIEHYCQRSPHYSVPHAFHQLMQYWLSTGKTVQQVDD